MKCEDSREMRFNEGVKASDRGLENTTPTVRCNEERPQQAGCQVLLLHKLANLTYLGKTSQAHTEFFFVVGRLTLRLYIICLIIKNMP
jgi:hypothetical protein